MRFNICCYDRDAQMLIKAVARHGHHYGAKFQRERCQYQCKQDEKTKLKCTSENFNENLNVVLYPK